MLINELIHTLIISIKHMNTKDNQSISTDTELINMEIPSTAWGLQCTSLYDVKKKQWQRDRKTEKRKTETKMKRRRCWVILTPTTEALSTIESSVTRHADEEDVEIS